MAVKRSAACGPDVHEDMKAALADVLRLTNDKVLVAAAMERGRRIDAAVTRYEEALNEIVALPTGDHEPYGPSIRHAREIARDVLSPGWRNRG